MARKSQSRDRSISRSTALTDRAMELIPGGSQTNSKAPTEYVRGVAPTYIERGQGSHVWDVDGNEYVDYQMALGPVTLGYNYPAVNEAVERQLRDGSMFTLSHPLEIDVAERFVEHVPCAEMVRFGKNGNDVTTLAAKMARAFTDRDVIATHGYHGWTDVWQAGGAGDWGIPDAVGEYTKRFEYNDVESLERIFEAHPDDVAAIVTTPIKFDPPEDDFLERLRELADREDCLLVFDEILTGFRYDVGGAQKYFGVTPDLACFAKGMANGYPISAITGRSDVMKILEHDDFVYSMTYAGEVLSLAAAKAAIDVQVEEDVTEHVWRQGNTLKDGYNDLVTEYDLTEYTGCQGLGPLTGVWFEGSEAVDGNLLTSVFQQECIERGVLFGRQLVSYSHTDEDVGHTLDTYEAALEELAAGIRAGDLDDRLRGDPIGVSFRERVSY